MSKLKNWIQIAQDYTLAWLFLATVVALVLWMEIRERANDAIYVIEPRHGNS